MIDVPANRVQNFDQAQKPGDFWFVGAQINFLCPCGCGIVAGISFADGQWSFDWNLDKPSCRPSININSGHWHGWLTAGVFTETAPI